MSKGFNYNKVNMQSRIAREAHLYDYPPSNTFGKSSWRKTGPRRHYLWKWVYLKKHHKESLVAISIADPGYIIFLYVNDVLFKALGREDATQYKIEVANQLEAVANRAQHILPPKPFDEFAVIVDANGVFERVEPVKKGHFPKKRLNKGSKIVKRIPELDIALPYSYENPKVGMRRMARLSAQHLLQAPYGRSRSLRKVVCN